MPLIRRLSVLIALVLGLGVMAAVTTTAQAAPDDSPFTRLRGFDLSGPDVRVSPQDFSASRVDLAALKAQLPGVSGSTVLSVPGPSGRLERFRVERTQLMESELAAAHPEITTYAGHGLDDDTLTIALDVTPMGFHASVRAAGGQRGWYVDPAFNVRGTTAHVSYYKAALPRPEKRKAEGEVQALRETIDAKRSADRITPGGPVTRRVYRLALTSDQSYAAYFGTANVLAEKVTLINRVNQIYNDDLAVNLRLVNATDALNLDTDAKAIGANGPCGASPCFTESNLESCFIDTLGKNRTVLGQLVGASNYDVGHIALGKNGGGIAYLGVVGGDYKGGGCTGLPIPTGDFFAIDYVAHEIGHQFNGDHTFNGALGNCGGNIGEPAVEPGSGSSVMAYAGICGRDDLQAHTDPYFSFKTVDQVNEMFEFDYSNIEVQTVSLRFFGAGDSFTLTYNGVTSDPITSGVNYTAAGIKAVVEELTGETVTITQWGFDEVWDSDDDGNPIVTAPDATGFQIIFNDGPTVFTADETDVDLPELTFAGTGVTGFVGETAQGGPVQPNGVATTAANTAPVVTAPADKTIPLRTPFALTGSGTDADGNALIYLWEQTDFGDGVQLAENNRVTGPLFRVFGQAADVTDEASLVSPSPGQNIADGSPTRIFPDLAQILAGNTNAAQPCPTPVEDEDTMMSRELRECYSELLPMAGYTGSLDNVDEQGVPLPPAMSFRLTARDRFVNGGGLAFDDVKLTIDPTTGPFLVTSQAVAGTVTGGAATPVTWAVNGTQKLAANVKISLSTDGGKTFGTVLTASTPNDGTESLTMPNVVSADSRIKIEAVDNYFFDISDASFTIVADPNAPNTTVTKGPKDKGFDPAKKVSFTYTSSEAGSTFACTLDGAPLTCDASGASATVKPGTHTFTVAATDPSGNVDATPATVTWARPLDDRVFTRSGGFSKEKSKKAYLKTFVEADRRGAVLTEKIKKADKVVLVVGTGKGFGKVDVFLGRTKLKTISLASKKTRFGVVVKVATFKNRKSGVLTVRTTSGKTVRIDGLGVLTD